MDEKNEENKAVAVFNNILKVALKMPGARVNRENFLRKELSKYYEDDTVDFVMQNGYRNSAVSKKTVDKIADSIIKRHTTEASLISFGTGIPGGLALVATIPGDIAQFYFHIIVVAQKLAYIYGWPDFGDEEPTEEFLSLLTLFIGIMSGAQAAEQAVGQLAGELAKQVAKRLPQMPLTKYGIFQVAKQVAKWFGVKLTKEGFSKTIAKAVPFVGGLLSGGISLATFLPMSNKLKKYLSSLPLAKQ